MPHWNVRHHPEGVTPDEHHKLLEIRRQTLEDATRTDGSLFPMPVVWRRGWRAYIRILGRDRDAALRAKIVVYGPAEHQRYVRKVRLVRSQPLPASLGLELREN
jgi:hypothetical protein